MKNYKARRIINETEDVLLDRVIQIEAGHIPTVQPWQAARAGGVFLDLGNA